MREVYQNFRKVLPLLADSEAARTPEKRAQLDAALTSLAERASLLDGHGRGLDPGARFLARGLGDDMLRAHRFLSSGDAEAASFALSQATDRCISCHTRVLDRDDAGVAAGLAKLPEVAGLAPLSRAALLVATRRFDEALSTYEGALTEPELEPIDLVPPLIDYLAVSVRVKGDLARPLPTLEKIAGRGDLWQRLRDDLLKWGQDLRAHAAHKPGTDVAAARAIVEAGQHSIELPSDRRALVHYLVASRILHQQVAASSEPSRELAEAYYWLGLVETRIGRNFWASPASFYLEEAIRLAPGSATAREAYGLLEEETLFGYSGSAGTFLPDEEQARLAELARLARDRGGAETPGSPSP